MRKELSKSPREEKRSFSRSNIAGRHLNPSSKYFAQVPVFTGVDDEEYFFEVEDF